MAFEQAFKSTALRQLVESAKQRNPTPIKVAVGSTGYIDERFLPEKPVSWGVDRFGRPFVTLCIGWQMRDVDRDQCAVVTLFQRYQDDPMTWVCARNIGTSPFSGGELKLSEIVVLSALIDGGQAWSLQEMLRLVEPDEIRRAHKWVDRPRDDDDPRAGVHADTDDTIITDAASPLGRHPVKP